MSESESEAKRTNASLPAEYIHRMLRVSPLTIGAVYKKGPQVGQGYVLNLSRGGVFLATDAAFQVGDRLRLRFFLPFQLGAVDAEVEVRWRTRDLEERSADFRSGLGLEFVALDDDTTSTIAEFIKRFTALADQLM